jgi:hypothetical protein
MKALTFNQFINEAYVDSEGNLKDFDFTEDEKVEFESIESIENIKKMLSSHGANVIKHQVQGPIFAILFKYMGETFVLQFNLDLGEGRIGQLFPKGIKTLMHNSSDAIIDYLIHAGLDDLTSSLN